MKLYQANKIYELVRNKHFDLMNDELLFIKEDKEFYYCKDVIGYTVGMTVKVNGTEFIEEIIKKGVNNECTMMDGFNEVISLLHEIGHFHNDITTGIRQVGYKEYKTKTYYSKNQAIKEYRQIPAEDYADKFAIKFLNENIENIWGIMQPELTKEEIQEWIEMFK